MDQKVVFEPHPKQLEYIKAVLSQQFRYLLFGGAAGGGKSYVSLAVLLVLHRLFPGSKSHVVRKSLPTLKRTTIPSFFKLCPKGFIRTYNQQDQLVTFTNGSSLQFFPENFDQDKILARFDGLETNWFLLEEGQELQKKTFEKCKLRAGRHIIPDRETQPRPMVLLTCNPSQNFTKELFHTPAKNGTLPPDFYYLQSLMADNPSLTDDYLQGLENLDEITRAIFVDGDWDVLDVQRPFAYSFDKFKTVRAGLTFYRDHPVILSFDFNRDPITCLAGQSYDQTIRVLKEYRLANSDIYELCARIRSDFPLVTFFEVTGDATGRNTTAMTKGATNYYLIIQQELNVPSYAFKVPQVNPSVKDSRVLLNSICARHPDFLIDASCLWTINDLLHVEVDDKGELIKDRANANREADLLDCLRYLLYTYNHDFVRYLNH